MPAYLIADVIRIKDDEKMEKYRNRIAECVGRFGGKYLAAGGALEVLEGHWRPTYPVIVQFPSLDSARQFYHSADYRELKLLRQAAADTDMVLIEGK